MIFPEVRFRVRYGVPQVRSLRWFRVNLYRRKPRVLSPPHHHHRTYYPTHMHLSVVTGFRALVGGCCFSSPLLRTPRKEFIQAKDDEDILLVGYLSVKVLPAEI